MKTLATLAALAIAALAPAAAHAERAVGISGNTRLVSFDTLSPGTASVKEISGLATNAEHVVGLDVRPATGELMAVTIPVGIASSALVRLYTLNPSTAAATLVGSVNSTVPGAGDRATGIDFNPLVDRLRVVQSNNENFRISPSSGGLAGDDTNLTYTAPATGPVTGIAYDRNVAPGPPGTIPPDTSKTTAYGIDTGSSRLVLIGSADGSPISPNTGQVTAVGQLGVTVVASTDAGFDNSPSGSAFATMSPVAGVSDLYSINLSTGAATDLGGLPSVVGSLAILPPDNCPSVDGDNQADLDGDGIGDACDPDIDGDGLSNAAEQGMGSNPSSADSDGDGKADGADSCPTLAAATANGCPDAAGGGPTGQAQSSDKTPPGVTVSGLAKKLKLAKFMKGVTLKVKPNEAASFMVELVATARSAKLAKSGELILATSKLSSSAAERAVKLKPNRKLVGKAKKFTVTVRITATDAAGNRTVVSRKVAVAR
jgi:hypothetical protein